MTQPNILFCIADDAGMHMGAYGCSWVNTPGFDRVAREGVLFTNAYTPNAKCAPSRACILTGRNSWQLKDAANHQCYFPAEFKTVMETLQGHGYHTGYTAKGWAPGDPGTVNGRPRQLTGAQYNNRKLTPPTTCISNNDYAGNFEEFLEDKPDDAPFCFWFGCLQPHRPYEYGSGSGKGGKKTSDIDHVYDVWPDTEVVRHDLLDYAKTEILKHQHDPEMRRYWELAFGKRPAEELYRVTEDPACIQNLAGDDAHQEIKNELEQQLMAELHEQNDPRITGEGPPLDENPTAKEDLRNFYDRFMRGELSTPGWIEDTDVDDLKDD